MILSERFQDVFIYASAIHAGQIRQKSGMPFIAHILGVTAIVLEHDGTEIEAMGALLHDSVEDAGGLERLEDVRSRFGDAVAEIVAGCTDSTATPRPPWRERKQAYLNHLRDASASVLLVSAADKLHNARALLRTLHTHGTAIFARYDEGMDGALWYCRSLVRVFRSIRSHPLNEELARAVTDIEEFTRL